MGMIKDHVCDHGRSPGSDLLGAWNGPIGKCECCGRTFGYINTGNYSGSGKISGRTWFPPDLCGPCGGDYVEY